MAQPRLDPVLVSFDPKSVSLIVAAEGCYSGGMTAAQCISTLYAAYTPTANDLAGVMLAIWTQLTPSELTGLLTTYYTAEQVQQAVTQAYAYFLDVMSRDTLLDQGQIPYPYNDVYQSPDIWVAGTSALPNPQVLLNSWMQGPTSNIYYNPNNNVTNYIYLRTTNLFPGATPWYADPGTGQLVPNQVYLHYSKASLLLQTDQWGNNLIPTAPNQNPVIPATMTATTQGQHVIALPAFQWIAPVPPSNDHYCLIARVVTYGHPNPVPPPGSLTDFCNYVRDNPNVAWRNVYIAYTQSRADALARAGADTTAGLTFPNSVIVVNPETTLQQYILQVVATNMPIGTTIQLQSADTGLNLGPVTVTQSSQTWQLSTLLAPNYNGLLSETIILPTNAVPTMGAQVSLINYAVGVQGTTLHDYGRPPEFYRIDAKALDLAETANAVFVGNFDMQFKPGADTDEVEGVSS